MSGEQVDFDPTDHPHRRCPSFSNTISCNLMTDGKIASPVNPLIGKHVLVSPHRTKRPWKGQTEPPVLAELPEHDPECYLCPGNERSGGLKNSQYTDTFVFENDFPALKTDPLPLAPPETGMFESQPVRGRCKVICFHPRHDLTLARMSVEDVVRVVEGWKGIYREEGEMLRAGSEEGAEGKGEGYVQIFENRGSMMGASAPHPHGQVWSLSYVPDEPATELANLAQHASSAVSYPTGPNGKPCLLCSYASEEITRKERVVEFDESGWVAVVPFWAVWPFELLVLPYKRHIPSLLQTTPEEDAGLARILKKVLVRYDNVFSCPFPYSMGLHQSPLPPTDPENDVAHMHFHFYPPLLRSASVRKFLVGFEMMGEVQRDLTAEQAAARLRGVDEVHYLDRAT